MKKIITGLVFILFAYDVAGQSFAKKRIVGGLNFDIGTYNTIYWLNDFPETKEEDRAGSKIVSLWGEYGLANWLGIGLKIAGSNYFVSKDSLTGITPSVRSTDIGLQLSWHIVKSTKFDLPLTLVVGSSSFKEDFKTSDHATLKDNGSFSNIVINPRFFFGSKAKFGVNLKLGWATYAYKSMDLKNDNNNFVDYFTLKSSGANFGIGIQYSFR
jgi:hypothetical protein